jgi:hypothetical protein
MQTDVCQNALPKQLTQLSNRHIHLLCYSTLVFTDTQNGNTACHPLLQPSLVQHRTLRSHACFLQNDMIPHLLQWVHIPYKNDSTLSDEEGKFVRENCTDNRKISWTERSPDVEHKKSELVSEINSSNWFFMICKCKGLQFLPAWQILMLTCGYCFVVATTRTCHPSYSCRVPHIVPCLFFLY